MGKIKLRSISDTIWFREVVFAYDGPFGCHEILWNNFAKDGI